MSDNQTEVIVREDSSTPVLAVANTELSYNKGLSLSSKEQSLLEELVKSSLTSVKTLGDGILLADIARNLNISISSAVQSIHFLPSSGKTTIVIGIHLRKALLTAAKVTWKYLDYFTPLYKYMDIVGNVYNKIDLPKEAEIVSANRFKRDANSSDTQLVTLVPKQKEPSDWISTVEFKRVLFNYKGEPVEHVKQYSYTWMQALRSGKPLDADNNFIPSSPWQRFRHVMVCKQAFVEGSDDFASDVLNGMGDHGFVQQSLTNETVLCDEHGDPIQQY